MVNLVSILIPAFNAKLWIGATIKSAINQTWSKKEIIIVDDGSEDSTLGIARKFESKKVKVISQKNQGASNARNKALEHAQGDYVQWLDADDLLDPNKISEQMKIAELESEPLTIFSGPYGIFYWRIEKAKFVPNALWQDLKPVEWLTEKFQNACWLIPACWLMSRKLAETAGPWDKRLTLDDDGEYFCRVIAASRMVKFVRNARTYYRQSVGQLSRKYSAQSLKSLLLSTYLCASYLISLEESEQAKRAVSKFLQHRLQILCQDKTNIIQELNMMAIKLGTELELPVYKWKRRQLIRLLGRKATSDFLNMSEKMRVYVCAKWDEILFRLSDSAVKTYKK